MRTLLNDIGNRDGRRPTVSAVGTHELPVYRLQGLPFVEVGGPSSLIDRQRQNDADRFHRIKVGGRPTGLGMVKDNHTVYVVNCLRYSIQVVDPDSRQVTSEIDTRGPEELLLDMTRTGDSPRWPAQL